MSDGIIKNEPNSDEKPELTEQELEQTSGGVLIGLLLPAVQKVDAPAKPSSELQVEQTLRPTIVPKL